MTGGETCGARAGRSGFFADERGVVFIVGAFFSMSLIGAAWYILGVGNAINYHETLQNAADSTAFGGAVYDARGMNVLAMLNLIMAAVLGVLVGAKLIQLIFMAVNLIMCLAGAIFNPACDVMTPLEAPLEEIVDDVGDAVSIILPILHYMESIVAVVWPWIAAGKSSITATYFAPKVAGGTSFAYSQIPFVSGSNPSALTNGISGAVGAISGSTDQRYGLPVTDDSYSNLCNYAGQDVVTFILGAIPFIPGGAKDAIASTLGKGIAAAGWFFCNEDGSSGDDSENAQSLANGAAESNGAPSPKDAIKDCHDKFTKAVDKAFDDYKSQVDKDDLDASLGVITPKQRNILNKAAHEAYIKTVDGPDRTNLDNCLKQAEALAKQPKTKPPSGGGGGGDMSGPKKLFPPATMGSPYMGVWSTAIGLFDDSIAKPIMVAKTKGGRDRKILGTPPDDAAVGIAKAEFYYEPQPITGGDSDTAANEVAVDIDHDCMYHMRWRARLRRYHPFPGGAMASAVLGLMEGNVSSALKVAEEAAGSEVTSQLPAAASGLEKYLPGGAQPGGSTEPPDIIH